MCLIIYGACCFGTAFVVLTAPVCTQYGMVAMIPVAPLVLLMGLFVIFALTFAGIRDSGVLGWGTALISLGFLGVLWISLRSTWRGLRTGPIVAPAVIILAAVLVLLNAAATFAFCLSMSV